MAEWSEETGTGSKCGRGKEIAQSVDEREVAEWSEEERELAT